MEYETKIISVEGEGDLAMVEAEVSLKVKLRGHKYQMRLLEIFGDASDPVRDNDGYWVKLGDPENLLAMINETLERQQHEILANERRHDLREDAKEVLGQLEGDAPRHHTYQFDFDHPKRIDLDHLPVQAL